MKQNRNSRRLSVSQIMLTIILMSQIILIGACKPYVQHDELGAQVDLGIHNGNQETLNIAERLNLLETVQIDVFIQGKRAATINDPKIIYELNNHLNSPLLLIERVNCSDYYVLVFHSESGKTEKLSIACGPQDPSFLRGEQSFWKGRDLILPLEFSRILLD